METNSVLGLIDQLDDNLESLEEVLKPILDDSLSATTKKLPLLDRAKLNITVVYAVESLLFSYFKVNGIDPREHPVYQEIERVKQYFAKIKQAEESSVMSRPSITLNKQAAARIIQHSLAGNANDKPDDQKMKELKERIMAKRKSQSQAPATPPVAVSPPIPEVSQAEVSEVLDSISKEIEMHDQEGSEEGEIEEEPQVHHSLPQIPPTAATQGKQPTRKKRKHDQHSSSKLSADQKAEKKARKQAKKEAKNTR